MAEQRRLNPIKTHLYDRKSRLKRVYGLSLEEYERMHAEQNGLCAICGSSDAKRPKHRVRGYLCVDHCHKTGKVRGLLCWKCNAAMGNLEDDIALLEKAAAYLRHHQRTA